MVNSFLQLGNLSELNVPQWITLTRRGVWCDVLVMVILGAHEFLLNHFFPLPNKIHAFSLNAGVADFQVKHRDVDSFTSIYYGRVFEF